jgi:hypothetical protein
MTRQALIENIDFRMQRRFPKTYIEGVIDMVWEQFCDILIKQDDAFFYTKKYEDVDVTLDVATDRYYSDIPALTVRGGIVSIYPEASRDSSIIQISERDFRLMADQEVFQVSEKIYCYVNFNRIYFDENMTSTIAAAGVSMDLLVTFSAFDIDDEIPIPKIGNVSLVDAVINYLTGTPMINLLAVNTEK